MPFYSFIIFALAVVAVQCADVSSQLGHYLDRILVITARARYIPNSFVFPGSEQMVPDQMDFLSGGVISVFSGYEPICTDTLKPIPASSMAYFLTRFFLSKTPVLALPSNTFTTKNARCTPVAANGMLLLKRAERDTKTHLACSARNNQELQLAEGMFLESAADPTQEPTAEPTAEPTLTPTRAPTLAPTTRPSMATSAYPTATQATNVTFSARQIVHGLSISQYKAHHTVNELTLKTAIAGCMDGVTINNFKKWQASAGESRRLEGIYLRRLTSSSSIQLVYTVNVRSKLTANQLFSQLSTNVANGNFNLLLQQAAQANNAGDLLHTESDSVELVDGGSNNNKISDGAVVGIVIGTVIGMLLLIVGIYMCIASVGSSGCCTGDRASRKLIPFEPVS